MTVVQAPEGASLQYTTGITKQVEQIILKQPEVDGVFAVDGFSFSGASPNRALLFARLKAFEERRSDGAIGAGAVTGRLFGQFSGIAGAIVVPILPPPIQGVGLARRLLVPGARSVRRTDHDLADAVRDLVGRGNTLGHADAALLELHRQRSAARRADQSRAGEGARAEPQRRHRDAADPDGLALRQRLRLQQPLVSRLRAGGSHVSVEPGRPAPLPRADAERADGAARRAAST